jgi:glycosyltransferase involved in cell wall biosynthesis
MAELTMLFVHSKTLGYGRLGVELAQALDNLGVDIYGRIEEHQTDEVPNLGPKFLIEQEGDRRFKRTNVVAWVSTPTHARGWWDGQIPVIFSMWEATEIPESFRENIHAFDTVIVPSDQNVELFSRYHDNVRKVPLGVDTEWWHYRERKAPTTEFRFLIGGSGPRKGTDVAHAAFQKLWGKDGSWGDGPAPRLIMKQPKPEDFYGKRVSIITGRLSAEDEVALYADAHCYLQPSRGEGFGLQPLQAIAQGCPTILTDAHGHANFAQHGWPLSTTMSKAGSFIYGDAGQWWEPSLDDLCDQMRWIYDHYADACQIAKVESAKARERFTWENSANAFLDAIGRDRLYAPYSGSGKWVEPEVRLYHLRVNTAWAADVAGTQYHFLPGIDYWEPADIKRLLYEAALLDPACLNATATDGAEFTHGLSLEQVTKLDKYRAEHAYCGTCNQRLGSGVKRADEEFAALEAAANG